MNDSLFHYLNLNFILLWRYNVIPLFLNITLRMIFFSWNRRCHWRFHADNAAKQIVYKFTDLQVDCEDELTVLQNGK